MSVTRAAYNVLIWLGLLRGYPAIPFFGLDNSGKTTLLHMLRTGKLGAPPITLHSEHETISIGELTFTTTDTGGIANANRSWKEFFPKVDAIVFLLDCADFDRIPDALALLNALLQSNELLEVPVLILGNKCDSIGSLSEEELRHHMSTAQTPVMNVDSNSGRHVQLFMCSVTRQEGYLEGFRWLSRQLRK